MSMTGQTVVSTSKSQDRDQPLVPISTDDAMNAID